VAEQTVLVAPLSREGDVESYRQSSHNEKPVPFYRRDARCATNHDKFVISERDTE